MSNESVVHLYKEIKQVGKEMVAYAACGQVLYKIYYQTTDVSKSTQLPYNVTCNNCKRTNYYKKQCNNVDVMRNVTKSYRDLIDEVDKEISNLIEERQLYVQVIQKIKYIQGESVKDEEREKKILENVGAEDNELIDAIYNEIFKSVESRYS